MAARVRRCEFVAPAGLDCNSHGMVFDRELQSPDWRAQDANQEIGVPGFAAVQCSAVPANCAFRFL